MSFTLLGLFGQPRLDALVRAMADNQMLHLAGACATPPHDLFSADDMEALLLRDGIENSLRLTINGHTMNLEMVGAARERRLRHLTLRSLIRQGASLILSDMQRHVPGLWSLACDAERVLRERVKIGAIASFSRIPALSAHYDEWDLILIQIEGSKLWRFFGESVNCGVPYHPAVTVPADVSATVTMRPGDVLFVPAGLHHQCEADGFSLHLGLLVEHATARNLVEDLLRDLASLHRPLRAVLGADALAAEMASLRDELAKAFARVDAAAWLANWNSRRARVTRLDLRSRPEPDDDAIAELAITLVPEAGGGERLKVGGVAIAASATTIAVLRTLMTGPTRVAEIVERLASEIDAAEVRAELEQLVDKGFVNLVPAIVDEVAMQRTTMARG